jgi:glycosyltransferase involved in cell wall biosynthesis
MMTNVNVPKVSIVIPTYNRARCVGNAVESVLSQTFEDFEILVVDDGSTDNTKDVLKKYAGNIRYIYQENQERCIARNNGIKHSKGEYIAFLDSDDIWLPHKLQAQVSILDQNPQVGLVYGQMFPLDPDGHWHFRRTKFTGWGEPGPARIFDKLVMMNLLPTPTVVARKSCFDHVGTFDPHLTCSEDWDLWLRISMHYEIFFMPEPLAGATFYENIPARRDAYRSEENRIRILEKIFSALPPHLRHFTHLKPLALARRYLDFAFLDYAVGRHLQAKRNFSTAISLDPSLLENKELMLALIVEHGFYFAGAWAQSNDVMLFIDTVLANLPQSAIELGSLKEKVKARVHLVDAFENYELGDLSKVRRNVLLAGFYDPILLKNRGIVSIFLESILGTEIMNWLRKSKNLVLS